MKVRVFVACYVLMRCSLASPSTDGASSGQKFSPPSRSFRFTYSFTVKDIPAGTKVVRVWTPVAHSDENQTVRLVDSQRTGETPDDAGTAIREQDDLCGGPQSRAGHQLPSPWCMRSLAANIRAAIMRNWRRKTASREWFRLR